MSLIGNLKPQKVDGYIGDLKPQKVDGYMVAIDTKALSWINLLDRLISKSGSLDPLQLKLSYALTRPSMYVVKLASMI